ncbi:MAG: dicarboxylate/amino acid:cation symporter [Firmicutes bacterium]|nr:dicarboxylate/amino acid:cation symporter [Bacillota bacterium]
MRLFKSKILKNYRFPIILLISIIIGSLIGIIFGEKASILKPFGDIFLNMMYTLVVPLVFFTISSSVANMTNMKRLGKILKSVFLVFIVTSAIAAIVMLIVLLIFDPTKNTNIVLEVGGEITKTNVLEQIVKALTVSDFGNLLSRNNMLPLIIFASVFGISLSLVEKEKKIVSNALNTISLALMKFIKIIMYYAPIGICAYFASLIGEFGPELLGSYAYSMAIYYIMCVLYFLVFYTLYAYISDKKRGVKTFYKNILPSTITSLATQSSLASLPTNLDTAKEIGIKKDIREVTLPLGATMHMEGSSMGSILKIVFLFGIFGKDFVGFDTYLIAILIAILGAVVMSGIPGGGLIGEMLIVTLYGFPLEAFPIIATIGWLIDPPATCLNVVGDVSSSMLVSKMVEGKNLSFNKFD